MKLLVTGATGGLGRNLVAHLLKAGYQVTATGRNQEIGKLLAEQGANFIPANLQQRNEVMPLCKNQDMVFHCAALSSPWGRFQDFYANNTVATKNIVSSCMEHGIARLIYVSTPSIYFNFNERFDIHETEPLTDKPANNYIATKIQAEQVIDNAFDQGLPVITIRPRGIFGPHDTAIIPRLIYANRHGKLPLINNGNAVIDVTYVENVVEALVLCMKAPTTSLGKKYNITNGEPIIQRELLQKIFCALDIPMQTKKVSYKVAYTAAMVMEQISKLLGYRYEPKFTRYTISLLALGQTLDITAAQQELNYSPRYSLDEGINNFAQWWKQNVAS